MDPFGLEPITLWGKDALNKIYEMRRDLQNDLFESGYGGFDAYGYTLSDFSGFAIPDMESLESIVDLLGHGASTAYLEDAIRFYDTYGGFAYDEDSNSSQWFWSIFGISSYPTISPPPIGPGSERHIARQSNRSQLSSSRSSPTSSAPSSGLSKRISQSPKDTSQDTPHTPQSQNTYVRPDHSGIDIPQFSKPQSRIYIVQPGDSFWSIAERHLYYGWMMYELAAYNGKSIHSVIYPGDRLVIPISQKA